MKRPLALVTVIPLFLKSASAQCSVCTNLRSSDTTDTNIKTTTSDLAFPNAILPDSTSAITCQKLNQQLGLLVPSIDTTNDLAECEALIAQESTTVDLPGYCGCHGEGNNAIAVLNSGCSYCSIDNTIDTDLFIDFYSVTEDTAQQWTCGNLAGLAPFISDASLCQKVQDFMPTCCGTGDLKVSLQAVKTCTLCGATDRATSPPEGRSNSAGSSSIVMGFLNRSIPVAVTGRFSSNQLQTCQEINERLGQDPLIVNDGDDGSQACSDQRSALMNGQDIYLDLPSYCGCPGSPAPGMCEFTCASGGSNAMNEDLVVDKLADGTKLTCGDILEAVPYIVDFGVCQDYQKYQSLCCANFEASCHLCPAATATGASSAPQMDHPEKIIPSLQRTCGLVNQYFGTVLSINDNDVTEECNNYRANENQNSIVDLESYCGCETATVAPNTCNFCAVENMMNPNLVLRNIVSGKAIDKLDAWGIAGSSMTCRAVAELAPIVTNDTFCGDLQYFQPICCPTDAQPTCTLCSSVAANGATLTKPNAIIPGRKETCGEVDQYFHVIQGGATACNAQRNGFETDIDLVAYCGCPGEEPPNQCNFCDAADLIDQEMVIGMGEEARTCGYLAEIAPYITNQTMCDWLTFAKPQCCKPKLESPCSVCPNQGSMGRPNSVVEHQTGTTCQELDETILQLPRAICTQVKGDWDFDLESFCGCEGAPPSSSMMGSRRCELCGSPGQVVRNQDMALPDKPSWTCEMGQQQAPFVSSKVICDSTIRTDANIELCCETATDNNSNYPEDSERTVDIDRGMEETGLSVTLLWIAAVFEIWIVLVFLLQRRRELGTVQSDPVQESEPPVNLAPASDTLETTALIHIVSEKEMAGWC